MGLLKTAAKVAVASSVHGRVQRRQQNRWAAQDHSSASVAAPPSPSQYATAAQPAGASDRLAQMKQLGELKSAGLLNEAEFEREKARILGS